MQVHWDTSSVMYPGIIRCFGSFNISHPRPGDPAGVDQTLACVPAVFAHISALLIQSHLVPFSAASVADLITFLFVSLVMPISVNTLQSDRPAPLEAHNKFARPASYTLPLAPGTWHASSHWPPPCTLPKAQ